MCGCWGWCGVVASDPTTSSLAIIVSASACPSSCNNCCSSAGRGSSAHSCHYCSTVATFLFTTFLWLIWWLCPTVKSSNKISVVSRSSHSIVFLAFTYKKFDRIYISFTCMSEINIQKEIMNITQVSLLNTYHLAALCYPIQGKCWKISPCYRG